VNKVYGIELNEDAINDAKFNAQSNGISNIEFIQGKAEDVISNVLENLDSELVAIIDPPRAGLRESFVIL
jgi:tRNA/tmRNA/rRNA uracil-C5-methylase (TrmA/RlmC/RlmD family)